MVNFVAARGAAVRLQAAVAAATAGCPACGGLARRVHSRYRRSLVDLAVGGREVLIDLLVRRFFCDRNERDRKTFAEQVEGLTAPYARRTAPARRVTEPLALAVGGRAGQRLGERLAVWVGRMTLLRLIRRLPDPATPTPRVLGVDDFALRRGHRYGTILIDVETGQPVDVLADRTAETFAAWLRAHPGVEIICRDRSGGYAEGASKGAPFALQVADRWHLVNNLSKAVERAVTPMRRHLQPVPQTADDCDVPVVSRALPASAIVTRTQARHADVHALLADGLGIYTIARRLNLDPKTVRRYADVPAAEDLLRPDRMLRASVLDPYKPYLQRRCAEGETNTTTLHAEIRTRGYRGGTRTLRRWLAGVRGPQPRVVTPPAAPSTRDITALIMRPGKDLTADERATLDQLCQRHEPLETLRALAHRFTTLIRHRVPDAAKRLDHWIAEAARTALPQLVTFANGLTYDRDAVIAGLTTPWSSGKVEGTVNKIKMLKRQMYGRANTDLLRKRILLAI